MHFRFNSRWRDALARRARWWLVGALVCARGCFLRARLALLYAATVWADPLGRARAPIWVRRGRRRRPAAVHLTAASGGGRQLRLLAHFWRDRPEQSCRALRALAGGAALLDVEGVVAAPRRAAAPRTVPLAFRVRLDLAAETATLTHAGAEAPCAHEAAALALGSAALCDALRPLLGRSGCPSLPPQRGG